MTPLEVLISVSLRKISIPISGVQTNLVLTKVLLDVGEGFITHCESVTTKLEWPTEKEERGSSTGLLLSHRFSIFK